MFGCVGAMILRMMNTSINAVRSGFEGTLTVSIRWIGPNTATLIAYALNKRLVVDTLTFRSSANCVNNPVTTYSVITRENVPIIHTDSIHFREKFHGFINNTLLSFTCFIVTNEYFII